MPAGFILQSAWPPHEFSVRRFEILIGLLTGPKQDDPNIMRDL